MKRAFYRPELDGLRFFAFLLVFLHHGMPAYADAYAHIGVPRLLAILIAGFVRAGGAGVDLFFVLSSYLITTLLLLEREAFGSLDVKKFWVRRILRIWPLYFTMLALTAIGLQWLPDENLTGKYVVSFAFFFGNWVCALSGFPASVAAPLWSVSVEEQFYLSWPLALRFIRTRRALLVVGASLIAFAIVVRHLTANLGELWLWCATVCRTDTFGAGIVLACLLDGRPTKLGGWQRAALAATGVALLCTIGVPNLRYELALPIAEVAALAFIVATVSDAAPRWLVSAPLVYLGRISYGLYALHRLGLALAKLCVPGNSPRSFGVSVVIGAGATVALAALSYRFLEQPFLRLKDRFTVVASHAARDS
jgi:peptidoglycan/LPS O-acetylase OafA/YrhL